MNVPNQSEERFKARFVIFNQKRRRQLESAAGSALLPEEEEMILEDHLHITSIRRQNPLPLFRVQLSMLTDLVTSEQAIAQYKSMKEERHRKLEGDVQDRDKLEDELRSINREIYFNRAVCRAIRDIADGIVWRLFDYDRATLAMIASRPASKHINPTGLEAELLEFSRVYDSREGIAVLNDLTNFLKLGDVTIRKDEGTFELVEVKTGHKSSGRITRQKQSLRNTLALINTGKANDEQICISQLEVNPEAYFGNLRHVIQEAGKKGIAHRRIGDYMLVECTDFEIATDMGFENIKPILDKARDCTDKWGKQGDIVIDLISQDKYMAVKHYAPFSIYPLPENTRVRLMIGSLFVVSYLNLSAVLRYIESRGWKIIKTPQEHSAERKESLAGEEIMLATIRKGPLKIAIPFQFFGRIGFEFLKPKSLVDSFEAQLSAGPTGSVKNLHNLSGESELWD